VKNNPVQRYCEAIKNINGYVGLVEYGTRNSNMFSDIDLMLVVSTCRDLETFHHELTCNKELVAMLKGGNVIVINRDMYPHLPKVDQFNLQIKDGMLPSIFQNSHSDDYLRDLLSILDWVPERIGRLDHMLLQKEQQIEKIIGVLYSLSHSFYYASRSIDKEYRLIQDHIKSIRKNLELSENLSCEFLWKAYPDIRSMSVKLVNTVLSKIYFQLDVSSVDGIDDCFRYYDTSSIVINDELENFNSALKYHLLRYQAMLELSGSHLKLLSSPRPQSILDAKLPIDNLMKQKLKFLTELDTDKIRKLKFFSPLRFGYLLNV
jgi:hypothetical protein